MKKSNYPKYLTYIALLFVLAVNGCAKPEPVELPFETLDQGTGFSRGKSYDEKKPDFLIITRPDAIDDPGLDIQFPPELIDQLEAVEYQGKFVLAIFRGRLGARSPRYTIEVNKIQRSGNRVIIYVHFGSPEPDAITQMALSSPYLILEIDKRGEWKKNIRFVLEVDGKEMKETKFYIP